MLSFLQEFKALIRLSVSIRTERKRRRKEGIEKKILSYFKERLVANSEEIKELLKGVVEIGTANSLKSNKYQVFGKTGSAEYGIDGKAHGWFVGCVQSDEKESIVITVLVEDGKTGKESAVPIAKELIEIYMGQ